MPTGTYFVRACPTCGRNLEVRVELLSRKVICNHCGAIFIADARSTDVTEDERIEQILARAQQYIESTMHLRRSTMVEPTPREEA